MLFAFSSEAFVLYYTKTEYFIVVASIYIYLSKLYFILYIMAKQFLRLCKWIDKNRFVDQSSYNTNNTSTIYLISFLQDIIKPKIVNSYFWSYILCILLAKNIFNIVTARFYKYLIRLYLVIHINYNIILSIISYMGFCRLPKLFNWNLFANNSSRNSDNSNTISLVSWKHDIV